MDFFATFAAICSQKLKAGEAPDSFNMLPTMLKLSPGNRQAHGIYAVGKRSQSYNSLSHGDYKIIWEKGRKPKFIEFYNLSKDLAETQNLINNPEFASYLKRMKEKVIKMLKHKYTREHFLKAD